MHASTKRRTLSVLLILAMLIVALAVIIPLAVSATPDPELPEIDDFSYQTLSALNLANDDDTDLRFVFTVGKLDYTEVGFVISKSNSTPTIGGANCYKAGTDKVYSTITADGTPQAAGDGRYWVAVKLTDIPHSYFDGSFYLCAFVTDGEGTRYSSVKSFTVCTAAGHTHTIDIFAHEMIGGTAAMNVVGTKIGHCSVCNLDNVTQYDTTTELEYQRWAGGGGTTSWVDSRKMSDVLAGGKHFYPDASNNYEGNDLYAEMSILWNESQLNFSGTEGGGARLETMFAGVKKSSSTYENTKALLYLSLTNNVSHSGSKIMGAIEYACPQLATSETGNPYPNMNKDGRGFSDYPNLGGTSQNYPEWGWHRIGIKYHEDVTNLAEVESSGADATYKLTVTLYIDGEVVSILSGTDLVSSTYDFKLYTVEKVGEDLVYTDIDEDIYFLLMKMSAFGADGQDAYFIDGDFFVTCGQDFVHPVTRIDNPAARTEVVNGQNFNGAFYYTTVGAHDHVWGELVNDASHAADCGTPATQSIHCTICGAVKGGSTVNLPVDPSLHNWGVTPVRTQEPTLLEDGVDRYTCTVCGAHDDRPVSFEHDVQIFTTSTSGSYNPYKDTLGNIRGSKHFYESGNDLLIEYSILWNESLTHLRDDNSDSYKPYMDVRLTSGSGAGEGNKNIIYWSLTSNIKGSDCKFAGGFEWGGISSDPGDNPYPRFAGKYDDITAYPNLGGNNNGDGTAQVNNLYGWHRIGVRYRNEVTNVNAVKGGAAATYNLEMWVYIDGVLVIHAYETDHKADSEPKDRKLFSAAYDGAGGITYTENDSLYLHSAYLNSKKMASGKGYFEIADFSVTVGSNFVQNVRKVTSPTPTEFEVENDVFIPTTMWYELDD